MCPFINLLGVFVFLTFCGMLASIYLIDVLITTDVIGYASLHRAVKNRDLKAILKCLDDGYGVNEHKWHGSTPMHFYRLQKGSRRDREILKILMDHGAIVTLLDDQGKAAFQYLFTCGDRKTLQTLLKYDVNLFARDAYHKTPLHFLMENYDSHVHELIEGKKFDINAQDSEGCTALSVAVMCCDVNKIEFLLEHGADANIADSLGETPLYAAVWSTETLSKESLKIVDLLLQYGADAQQLPFEETENIVSHILVGSVIAHLAMIESRGQILTQSIRSQINSKVVYKDYFTECQRQLEEMKTIIVCETVTLYKLLTDDPNKIAHYTCNLEFSLKFKAILRNMIALMVTYYYHVLRKRVGKAIQKAQINIRAATTVCQLTGFDLTSHSIIVTKIAEYLNFEDFKDVHVNQEQETFSLGSLFT